MEEYTQIGAYFSEGGKGNEANRLEREALQDPFLYEALEGLEEVEGPHGQIIGELQEQIRYRSTSQRRNFRTLMYSGVAAACLLLATVAVGLLLNGRSEHSVLVAEVGGSETAISRENGVEAMQDAEEWIMPYIANEEEIIALRNAMEQEAAMRKMELAESMKKREEKRPVSLPVAPVAIEEDSVKIASEQFEDARIQTSDSARRFQTLAEESPEKLYSATDESEGDEAWVGAQGMIKTRKAGLEKTNASRGKKREKQEETGVQEQEEFAKYIAESLRYPEDARLEGLEGDVVLGVYLNKKGRISHLKVLQKLSSSCDREAIRLLEEYKGAWSTEKRHFTVVVPFRLDRKVNPSSGS